MGHPLKGNGVSLVLQDTRNVLQLLGHVTKGGAGHVMRYVDHMITYCVKPTGSDDDFIHQSSNGPNVHLVVIVLWGGREGGRRELNRREALESGSNVKQM